MTKAVLDVDVILSGLIRPEGPPGRLLTLWDQGEFELVVSALLLDELRGALAYPKLGDRIDFQTGADLLALIERAGHCATDPADLPPVRCDDPADDYLIALALKEDAILVSGDKQLLAVAAVIPVLSPREFLDRLRTPRD